MPVRIAVFESDVTPPLGYPLCAGWYPPARVVADRLAALGVIIAPDDQPPIVLCALDWAELSNGDYDRWRQDLARAVGTDADRVAVHCIHAHDTPWPDREAQNALDAVGRPDVIMAGDWDQTVRTAAADAAAQAMTRLQPCTHISCGSAAVDQIASTRRVMGPDGKVTHVRYTKTMDPAIRAAPIGDIDPLLRTLGFWNGEKLVTRLHYYAVHPTSVDGRGEVSCEFVGLARNRCAAEDGVPHLYFTGCAGDVTAGKFNDGDPANRAVFTQRIYAAMREAQRGESREPLNRIAWRVEPVRLPPREDLDEATLLDVMRQRGTHDKTASRAALMLTYLRRAERPIPVTALHLNRRAAVLHLPGEAFVEYQFHAQGRRPDDFIAVASYGDLGTGYICRERSFAEGGYEPTDAFVAARSEAILKRAIDAVLA